MFNDMLDFSFEVPSKLLKYKQEEIQKRLMITKENA